MSTQWDSFNSRLLNALNKKWVGLFYVKFLEGLQNFSEKKELKEMVLTLFPKPEREVSPPSLQAIQAFGTGNVGKDQEGLMFLDQYINGVLQRILSGESQEVSIENESSPVASYGVSSSLALFL